MHPQGVQLFELYLTAAVEVDIIDLSWSETETEFTIHSEVDRASQENYVNSYIEKADISYFKDTGLISHFKHDLNIDYDPDDPKSPYKVSDFSNIHISYDNVEALGDDNSNAFVSFNYWVIFPIFILPIIKKTK